MTTLITYPISSTGIENTTPFVLIKIPYPSELLIEKYVDNDIVICEINMDKLSSVIGTSSFAKIADVIINKRNIQNNIDVIIVNKINNVSRIPPLYERVMKLGHGYVWQPISLSVPHSFIGIGLIYSDKNPSYDYRIIHKSYLINLSTNIPKPITSKHLISTIGSMFITERNDKILINDKYLNVVIGVGNDKPKIENFVGEWMKPSETKNNIVPFDSTIDNNGEISTQTPTPVVMPDGRLEFGNKCLDVDDSNNVVYNNCVDTQPQQWLFHNGHILHNTTGKCLKNTNQQNENHNLDQFSLDNCNIEKTGNFTGEQKPTWTKKFGKNVVLVSSENPWYVNTAISEPTQIKQPTTVTHPEYTDFYKPFGIFSKHNINKTTNAQPTLGVELFEPSTDEKPYFATNILYIISCLMSILLIFHLIRLYKNST